MGGNNDGMEMGGQAVLLRYYGGDNLTAILWRFAAKRGRSLCRVWVDAVFVLSSNDGVR